MSHDHPDIPPALYRQLLDLKPILCRQGVVALRGDGDRRRTWRLRYREPAETSNQGTGTGRRRHRSIPLGGPLTAAAIKDLLAQWRGAAWQAEQFRLGPEAEERARQQALIGEERAMVHDLRAMRREAQELAGGGRRRRRAVGRRFDEAVATGGPFAAYAFIELGWFAKPNGRPGRPRKAGLYTPPKPSGAQGDSAWARISNKVSPWRNRASGQ